MEKFRVVEVFTPGTPAKLTFVERQEINNQLVDSLRTPGKQIVVYGPSGSGKTTLLFNKLYQIYPDHITSRCTAATSFESLILNAFDELNPYYTAEISFKKSKSYSSSLNVEYMKIKSAIQATYSEEKSFKIERILPPQLTPQRLAAFCGAAECCWVLEDFHKVPESEKTKVSQIMKVFMDVAVDYPDVRVVAIGAVNSAREVIKYDSDMRNRVSEVAVPLMSETELAEIIRKGEKLLNMNFNNVGNKITSYSSGLAAICHQLCLNVCFAAEIIETSDTLVHVSDEQLHAAFDRHMKDASDTLKEVFDLALRRYRSRRFDNTRLILQALAHYENPGATHAQIIAEVRRREPTFPASNATTYLRELQSPERGSILRYDPWSGMFCFSDPLYLSFARCVFQPESYRVKGSLKWFGMDITRERVAWAFMEKQAKIFRQQNLSLSQKLSEKLSQKPRG